MDDEGPREQPPRLLNFRKRWTSERSSDAAASDASFSQVEHVHDQLETESVHTGPDLDLFAVDDSWEHCTAADDLYEPESPFDSGHEPAGGPVVFDPRRTEPAWTNIALSTASKRQRLEQPKLPWELGPFKQIFGTGDPWQGTILANQSDLFVPARLGCFDVLQSTVTTTPHSATSSFVEPPVMKLNLKRVRHELPDEDIRRVAICKLRDLILQDPMATQLGVSLSSQVLHGGASKIAEQSIRDCFRMKASSTLQKRAGSLWRLAKTLRGFGILNPLRLEEEQLYQALCSLRETGAGATAAQHMLEALFFLDATAKLVLVDIRSVVSGRCRGVAKDMYLTKNPLEQKHPLLVIHVRYLEHLFPTLPSTMQCILGHLLFCIHACCRWKDSQRLRSLTVEEGHGETLIHADALQSKTTVSAESRTRFLPYIALGTGVTGNDWGSAWISARDQEHLSFGEFSLPSFSERSCQWTASPMSASEATYWLREFLEGAAEPGAGLNNYGSHSCKRTILTWAGRCLRVQFSPMERRLLGHHLETSMRSILTYSKESYVTLYSKVLQMFRLMREKQFDPDASTIDRVVQLSDDPAPDHANDQPVETVEETHPSDSESSVASECGEAGDEMFAGYADGLALTSLFPDFPGVPESSLVVHKVSGLVHVLNEDGFLACGRQSSLNFKVYSQFRDRSLAEGCTQCKRAFLARRAESRAQP
eukprot:s1638_g17.t1